MSARPCQVEILPEANRNLNELLGELPDTDSRLRLLTALTDLLPRLQYFPELGVRLPARPTIRRTLLIKRLAVYYQWQYDDASCLVQILAIRDTRRDPDSLRF